MKLKLVYLLVIFLMNFSLVACKNTKEEKPKDWNKINKELIKVNSYLVKEDRERIEKYIERNNLKMRETSTGLWYAITKQGQGDSIKEGQIAVINYSIELLDGTKCYSSDSLGSLTFKVGKSDVASGLDQGIKKMRQGDHAIFILPPHLAYGLVGDDNKIPSRSILVYYVELLKIK